jgi:hypothetical protein
MTKDEKHLEYLNKYLSDYFPHFRMVWNADQFEYRYGTFETHYPVYCSITETREVPKYNWIDPHTYILETRAIANIPEIKNHNGWDIAFPWLDQNGNSVFPDMESLQFMMNELVVSKRSLPNEKAAEEAEQKSFDKEVEEIEERLGE